MRMRSSFQLCLVVASACADDRVDLTDRAVPPIAQRLDPFCTDCPPDTDFDGIEDARDNCPHFPNVAQSDDDQDGAGNVCDCDYPLVPEGGPCHDLDASTFFSRCLHKECVGTADIDRDGVADVDDCIIGSAADIKTMTLERPTLRVDGATEFPGKLAGAHLMALYDGDRLLAEYTWDCRRPLLMSQLTIESQASAKEGGFLRIDGVALPPGRGATLFLPAPPRERADPLPSVCVRDTASAADPKVPLDHLSTDCTGRDERLIPCSTEAPKTPDAVACLIDATQIQVTNLQRGQVCGPCRLGLCPCVPILPIKGCVLDLNGDCDADGYRNADDCAPFDPTIHPGQPIVHCNRADDGCLCTSKICADLGGFCTSTCAGDGWCMFGCVLIFGQICNLTCTLGDAPVCARFNCAACEHPICDAINECGFGLFPDDPVCPSQPLGTACSADSLQCTFDQCDGAGSCAHPPAPAGTACVDPNPCTTGDTCNGTGGCLGGTPLANGSTPAGCNGDTTPGDCRRRSCQAGVCTNDSLLVSAGTACNDANVCTSGDACTATGVCQGAPLTNGATPTGCNGDSTPGNCRRQSCQAGTCANDSLIEPNLTNCTNGGECMGGACFRKQCCNTVAKDNTQTTGVDCTVYHAGLETRACSNQSATAMSSPFTCNQLDAFEVPDGSFLLVEFVSGGPSACGLCAINPANCRVALCNGCVDFVPPRSINVASALSGPGDSDVYPINNDFTPDNLRVCGVSTGMPSANYCFLSPP